MADQDDMKTLDAFVADWEESENNCKTAFLRLKSHLCEKEGVMLNFISRPGVSYSLRARHPEQQTRPVFVLVDVIEDDPRWLSVCFYGDMISDPDEIGDLVPGGLLGEDGYCFDVEALEEALLEYILRRLDEAWEKAAE